MTNIDIVRKAQNQFLQKGRPDIKTGMEIEVYQKIKEGNKERIQRYKGIVIKVAGKSELEKTITVRRKVGAFGVEKIFAVHSSTIEKIEILRQFKVRRKSIKFIRDLTGKAARLKEVKSDIAELNQEKALPVIDLPVEELQAEAPKAEETVSENTQDQAESSNEEVKAEETPVEKKEEAPTETVEKDDLTKIEGIGPKIAETLIAGWVATYADLATKAPADIDEMIKDVAGSHVSDTWPEQAKMAADGKWDELKKWQDELDGGKPAE